MCPHKWILQIIGVQISKASLWTACRYPLVTPQFWWQQICHLYCLYLNISNYFSGPLIVHIMDYISHSKATKFFITFFHMDRTASQQFKFSPLWQLNDGLAPFYDLSEDINLHCILYWGSNVYIYIYMETFWSINYSCEEMWRKPSVCHCILY